MESQSPGGQRREDSFRGRIERTQETEFTLVWKEVCQAAGQDRATSAEDAEQVSFQGREEPMWSRRPTSPWQTLGK